MLNPITFYASEARTKLFKIFKMVTEGQDVIIIKRDSNQKFKISLFEEKPKKDINKILKEMGEIGLKSMPIKEMKKIYANKYSE